MQKIKVSSITPCYRMKTYLKKFLDELPNQTYFENLEIVLDHNEPDDEEINWVKDFQVKYPGKIKHIVVDKVDPIGVSMNRCVKEASGELLTIWNVDDLRTSKSIESQVNAIIEKNADIAIGDYIIVRKFGSITGSIVEHKNIKIKEYTRSMVFGPFLMFKKKLCERAGYFDEQLKSGADFDLSVRLAYNGKTAVAEDLLGYYLNEGKGASTRPNSKQPAERTVIEMRYGIFEKIDLSFIPKTVQYSIPYITFFNESFPVNKFVPHYLSIIENNQSKINLSILKTFFIHTSGYSKFKFFIKTKIKKIIHK